MRIIIDGYNLLFAGDLVPNTSKGLEKARDRLISLLTNYNRKRKHQIRVVFDAGSGLRSKIPQKQRQTKEFVQLFHQGSTNIKTIFTQPDKDADTFIIEAVVNDACQTDILVVTSDRTIRNALRHTRAKLVKADKFLKELGIQDISASQKPPEPLEPPEKTHGLPRSEVAVG